MAVAAEAAEMLNTEVPVFAVNRWMQTVCRGRKKKKRNFIDTACASKQTCWHWSTLHTRLYGCLGCSGLFIFIFLHLYYYHFYHLLCHKEQIDSYLHAQ